MYLLHDRSKQISHSTSNSLTSDTQMVYLLHDRDTQMVYFLHDRSKQISYRTSNSKQATRSGRSEENTRPTFPDCVVDVPDLLFPYMDKDLWSA